MIIVGQNKTKVYKKKEINTETSVTPSLTLPCEDNYH